jgi:glycosyltransferase involved in cell wall biosynthesis
VNSPVSSWPQKVFILIPAYKAAKDLQTFLPVLLKKAPSEFLCLVDDASGDGTKEIAERYHVDYLVHEVNRGKGAALKTGFRHLLTKEARWILTMDADGQHAIEDIPLFLEGIQTETNTGIIIGARNFTMATMPPARIFSNSVTSKMLSILCGKKILDSQSGYRMYSAELLKKIPLIFNRFELESEVILKSCAAGFDIQFVPIQTLYCSSHSHISHLKDMYRWVRAVWRVWLQLWRNKG